MKIALDIDGVIRDVVSAATELYSDHFQVKVEPKDVLEYNMKEAFPLLADPVNWFFVEHSKEILGKAHSFDWALEAVKILKTLGEVVIISIQPNNEAMIATTNWLWNYGFADKVDGICLTTKKDKRSLINGYDIVIDDYPENFRNIKTRLAVLIDAPYNQDFDPYLENKRYEFPDNIIRFYSLYGFASSLKYIMENIKTSKENFENLLKIGQTTYIDML